MRKRGWAGTLAFASFVAVLIGCGGAGGSDAGGASGGSGGSGGGGSQQEQGTARVEVNTETGAVSVTPLGKNDGPQSQSLYAGSAVSVSSSSLSTDPGELTVRRLKLSIRNNTGDIIGEGGNAKLTVESLAANTATLDLRPLTSVATIIGPGSSANDGPGSSVTASGPAGMDLDSSGVLYLASSGDGSLRRVKDNYVTRIATGLLSPGGVGISGSSAFVVEQTAHQLSRVSTSGSAKFVMAGNGTTGLVDGAGAAARFNTPRDIEIIGTTAYISDLNNDRIRTATNLAGGSATIATLSVFPTIVRPSGLATLTVGGITWLVVTSTQTHNIYLVNVANGQAFTIAGTGTTGSTDGLGSVAKFNTPFDATVSGGAIFVSDLGGRTVRQLVLNEGALPQFASSWMVKTVAGTGAAGVLDGPGSTAQFSSPRFMETDGSGAVALGDQTVNRVRLVSASSGVYPIGGGGGAGGAVDASGMDGYDPNPTASAQRKPYYKVPTIQPKGTVGDTVEREIEFVVGSGVTSFSFVVSLAGTSNASSAALDAVTNSSTPLIGSPNVNIRTIAGGSYGWADGIGTVAKFGGTPIVASCRIGQFVSDPNNATVRFIDLNGRVSTVAGILGVTGNGAVNGSGATGSLEYPFGITANDAGTELYVTDYVDSVVMRLSRPDYSDPTVPTNWTIAIIAGAAGNSGNAVGTGVSARFSQLFGIVAEPDGRTLYVCDRSNQCIKMLTFNGSDRDNPAHWGVSFYAGSTLGASGDTDGVGTTALFNAPNDLDLTLDGGLIVVEVGAHRLRKIDALGVVTLLAGSATGISGFQDGVGASARFTAPVQVCTDDSGYAYVSGSETIRRVHIATGEVKTVAGTSGAAVAVDGPGNVGTFLSSTSVDFAPGQGVVVADDASIRLVERVIRRGQP